MASTFISLPFNALAIESLSVGLEPVSFAPGQTIGLTGANEYDFDEIVDLAANASETIISHYFATQYKLRKVSTTGSSVGVYTVVFDGNPIDKKRSTVTDYNCEFDYETGITIPAGTTVSVIVQNTSTVNAGTFSARLLFSAQ
jgi:hypothetical protein